mgnify:CR=1 FL=1
MNYNFPDHITGDTFQGVQFEILVNELPLDITGSTISMVCRPTMLRAGQTQHTVFNFDSNSFEILDGAAGKFTFKKQVVSLAENVYKYSIKITLSNNDVHTYISGSWTITDKL